MYDIIVIGGGISSLYTAYKLLNKKPDLKLLVLEKSSHLGGRTWKEHFANTRVVVGAGILRKDKDNIAMELVKELKIPYNESKHPKSYILPFNVNVKEIFMKLKKYYKDKPENITFKKFATKHIGVELYKQFRIQSGFTDYDNQNVYDTLYNYSFDDNYSNNTAVFLDWVLLIEGLKNALKKYNNFTLHTNVTVKKVLYDNHYIVNTNKKDYEANIVINGTDVDSFRKIFNSLLPMKLYNIIQGQPFLLVYAKISKSSIPIMANYIKGFTICMPPINKIIPISSSVYLISYCDNINAVKLKPYVKNKKYLSNLVKNTLNMKEDIKIISLHHYYKPHNIDNFHNKVLNPMDNLYVVGEMIAVKQGWINGALSTSIDVANKIIAKSL